MVKIGTVECLTYLHLEPNEDTFENRQFTKCSLIITSMIFSFFLISAFLLAPEDPFGGMINKKK